MPIRNQAHPWDKKPFSRDEERDERGGRLVANPRIGFAVSRSHSAPTADPPSRRWRTGADQLRSLPASLYVNCCSTPAAPAAAFAVTMSAFCCV
jgi:hypothetical protein